MYAGNPDAKLRIPVLFLGVAQTTLSSNIGTSAPAQDFFLSEEKKRRMNYMYKIRSRASLVDRTEEEKIDVCPHLNMGLGNTDETLLRAATASPYRLGMCIASGLRCEFRGPNYERCSSFNRGTAPPDSRLSNEEKMRLLHERQDTLTELLRAQADPSDVLGRGDYNW